MARPLKKGLDFFNLDTNIETDPKIEYIEAKHGLIGFGIYIKLLIKIYREGYFVKLGEKEQLILSARINVDNNSISTIVIDCINEDLFNLNLYEKYQILSSNRIQKQYIIAFARRRNVVLHKELLLINSSDPLLKQGNIVFRPYLGVIVDNNPLLTKVIVNNNPSPAQVIVNQKYTN